jgi:RNA polymerase sigma-70 factor, ECF subfamily
MRSVYASSIAHVQNNSEKPSPEAEELLIERTLGGSTDAFGDLIKPHLSALNRLARARLGSSLEAEDVVQQAILRAYRHLEQFRRDASFRTWLSAIAIHEVIHLRRRRALRLRPLQPTHAANLADVSVSPHMAVERSQEAERLHRALTKIPEKYRVLIQMRDLSELSVAETARSLSLSAAAVRTRHTRARKMLVRSLRSAKSAA